MSHKLWLMVKWIQALKERENHKTILKNKRKTKNGSSQSNSKAGIHERSINSRSRTKSVNPLSRSHFKSHQKLKTLNPRKSQKLKKILEMMKSVMKWDFTQGSTILTTKGVLVTLWVCWRSCHQCGLWFADPFLKMAKMMRSDGDRYRQTYWAYQKHIATLYTLMKISQIRTENKVHESFVKENWTSQRKTPRLKFCWKRVMIHLKLSVQIDVLVIDSFWTESRKRTFPNVFIIIK